MPTPDNFSSTEQFQDATLKIVNKLVKERFKDVKSIDDNLQLTVPREALKKACIHKEDDSINLTIGRLLLFTNVCGFGLEQVWDLFGGEVERRLGGVRHRPQVKLFFRESDFDTDPSFLPLTSVVSFRLANETSESYTMAQAEALAKQIESTFAKPTLYKWRRGKELVTYKDLEAGYNFQIYAFNDTEAERVIKDCLALTRGKFDQTLFNKHNNKAPAQAYPTLPPKKRVLGKMTQQPRERPVGNIAFRYAQLQIQNRIKPLTLVDTTWNFPNALRRV